MMKSTKRNSIEVLRLAEIISVLKLDQIPTYINDDTIRSQMKSLYTVESYSLAPNGKFNFLKCPYPSPAGEGYYEYKLMKCKECFAFAPDEKGSSCRLVNCDKNGIDINQLNEAINFFLENFKRRRTK